MIQDSKVALSNQVRFMYDSCQVASGFSREQSKAALALHLSTRHYMERLMEAVKPGQLNCHPCDLVFGLPQVKFQKTRYAEYDSAPFLI